MTLQQFNPTIKALEKKSSDLSREINDLKDAIAELKSDDDFPQLGQEYWYVDEYGEVEVGWYKKNNNVADNYVSIGNCFKTREEAEKYKLRLESMKPKYLPKKGENYFSASPHLYSGQIVIRKLEWRNDSVDQDQYLLGRTFKTYEQALEWINKYQDAWRL